MVALPLFVLPMVLMPGEVQELRVFEPRYRQMLDDCLLDEKNFGLVMNDPFQPVNGWDGPRQHGCEVEILHHETKGSNHFLQIVGRRRFTVLNIAKPALPPFSDPMFESLVGEDGLLPDLQALLEMIPEDVEHSKLYISADVEYHSQEEVTSLEHQDILKKILDHVLHRIGTVLRIEEETLMQWVKERVTLPSVKTRTLSIQYPPSWSMNWNQNSRFWLAIHLQRPLMNFYTMWKWYKKKSNF